MEPASAAILEFPDFRGVEFGTGINAVGIEETTIDLPRAVAAIEFECPGGDNLVAVENRQCGFEYGRHGAVVNSCVQHVKAHEREGLRGIHAVRPSAILLNHGVVEENVS